ncbi:odorant receptor Or2-like [Vanessa atalanta]|uniref:odorant receptor Or2-like n=1 Tax=Vanessa atalanta TaxID=42275 RepID=UPI001FCD0AC9|nr:odorant receptor Or2-like [Vanessa atalanta]
MMKLSLGKFGLKHCDLPTLFSNVAFFLRFITINIDRHYKKRIPFVNYVIVTIAAVCYIYIYIISMFWFVFVRCRQTGDFTAAAVVFSLGTNSETCATKLIFMIIYKKTVQDIVQRYLECDKQVEKGTRFYDNLQKKLIKIKKRTMAVSVFLIVMGISYSLQPILLPGRHFAEDLYVVYGLEPMFESPNYEIALISETITIIVGTYTLACVTAFILIIIGYIEAQMLALSDEMLNLWDDAEKYYNNSKRSIAYNSTTQEEELKLKIINEHIANRLKQIIPFHISNINLLNEFETLFRITMAVEFGLIIIGIVAELLGRIENTFMELPYTLIQIYVDCFIGQRLIDASFVFERAVYDCKWENFNKSNMKTILLILQNAQKPLKLTAGGLTTLDFVCLMSVIKSTYSFYTTLQSSVG